MEVKFKHRGRFTKTIAFFNNAKQIRYRSILNRYGRAGVRALSAATPIDSKETSLAWAYDIEIKKDRILLNWTNSNIKDGSVIAILLQFGHATRNGGFVKGRDYINPALRPIFNNLADAAWREVTKI